MEGDFEEEWLDFLEQKDTENLKRLIEEAKGKRQDPTDFIDALDDEGNSALHVFLSLEPLDTSFLRYLLENKADPTLENEQEASGFLLGFQHGDASLLEHLLPALTEHKAQIHTALRGYCQNRGIQAEFLLKLLELGADVNDKDEDGNSAFYFACRNEQVGEGLLRTLIERAGETLDCLGGVRGLCENAKTPNLELFKVLVARGGIDVAKQQINRKSLIELAAAQSNAAMVRYLLGLGEKEISREFGSKCLHLVCVHGDIETIQRFLAQGQGEINQRDRFSKSLLDYAVEEQQRALVGFLLQQKADTNLRDRDGNTPLLSLCSGEEGNAEIARLLLEGGASPNVKDEEDESTPLHHCVSNKNLPLITLLLQHGADINLQNSSGETPVQLASEDREVEELIKKHKN